MEDKSFVSKFKSEKHRQQHISVHYLKANGRISSVTHEQTLRQLVDTILHTYSDKLTDLLNS
jgi:hypothetical protein